MTDTHPHTSLIGRYLKSGVTESAPGGEVDASRTSGFVLFGAKLLATAGFVGYVPFAQGTFGSLWGAVAYLVVYLSGMVFSPVPVMWIFFALTVVVYFVGVWSAGVCERIWGHDPGRVVIDEVAGMLVTMLFLPVAVDTVAIGFVLFRAFDIFKPQPVRLCERLPRGWGIMTDDIVAGVYANLSLRIIIVVLSVVL